MARSDQKFVATFYGATRHGTSVNGNPTWNLRTSEGVYRTQSDAGLGYSIGNYIGRSDNALIGKRVEFTATKAGRVWNMVEVASDDTMVNGLGETLYVITIWSPAALDHVTAHVWAADRNRALVQVDRDYGGRVDSIREGTAADLD